MKTKIFLAVICLTIGVIAFGIMVGLTACASVQGLNVCLDYFTRALATIF